MNQLSFDMPDAAPRARRRDPITSHLAAEQAREMAQAHHALILGVLSRHGPGGKDRIAALTRLTGTQICRRLSELEKLGMARPTGRTVESTAGRREREWEIAR